MTDEIKPSFTLFFKMGVVGLADEVHETLEFTFDPELSAEQNTKIMEAKAQIFAARLQLSYLELMTVKFPEFIQAKAEDEGWDPDTLLR